MSSANNSDPASGGDRRTPDSEKTSFMTTLGAKNDGVDAGAAAGVEKQALGKPDTGKSDAGKSAASQPDTVTSEVLKPGTGRTDAAKSDTGESVAATAGAAKAGGTGSADTSSAAASTVSASTATADATPAPRSTSGTVGATGKDASSAARSESRSDSLRADAPAATPPWQRTTVAGQSATPAAGQSAGQSSTQPPDATKSSGYASSGAPAGPSTGAGGGEATIMTQPVGGGQQSGAGRTAVTFPAGNVRPPGQAPGAAPGAQSAQSRPTGGSSTGGSSTSGGRRPGRGPRRASLQIKRIDPWSVLKLTLVLSMAMFVVWLIAVGVLYGVLDGMQVWDQLNGTYNDLAGESADSALISAGRVFGVAAIIGAVNIVLFTALATVGAFVYNVSADLAGGIEVTLSERD